MLFGCGGIRASPLTFPHMYPGVCLCGAGCGDVVKCVMV